MYIELTRDSRIVLPPLDPNVTSLRIWHCKYRTVRSVGEFRELQTLVIATFPDESLVFLTSLQRLRHLQIVHMPKVNDLSPLGELRNLESLSLETLPSWDASGKVTQVGSLEPLADLPGLKHLALFGVVPTTKSLSALERCPRLVSARFSKYPKAEVSRFYERTIVSDEHVPWPPVG
jgi:hypothetical protein